MTLAIKQWEHSGINMDFVHFFGGGKMLKPSTIGGSEGSFTEQNCRLDVGSTTLMMISAV